MKKKLIILSVMTITPLLIYPAGKKGHSQSYIHRKAGPKKSESRINETDSDVVARKKSNVVAPEKSNSGGGRRKK